MPNHKTEQPIPVLTDVPPTAIPLTAWLILFDAVRRCGSYVMIHADDATYHAERALKLWADAEGLKAYENEIEVAGTGERYINLYCKTGKPSSEIVILRIRELARLNHGADDVPDPDDAMDEPELPDSNETLGISVDVNRDGWR